MKAMSMGRRAAGALFGLAAEAGSFGRFTRPAALILVLGFACTPLAAEIQKTAVVGEPGIHVYWWPRLPTVNGWHQDMDQSHRYSVNALAPDGASFAKAETVIYAKALYKPREPEAKSLDMLIASDRKTFEADYPGVRVEATAPLWTSDGKKMRSFTFFPTTKGNWEQVVYGEEGDYYLIFTISSRSEAGYRSALPTLEYLIGHYKEKP